MFIFNFPRVFLIKLMQLIPALKIFQILFFKCAFDSILFINIVIQSDRFTEYRYCVNVTQILFKKLFANSEMATIKNSDQNLINIYCEC